jgi:hypothetical protein
MSTPTVLPWHTKCADNWYEDEVLSPLLARAIARHDPHAAQPLLGESTANPQPAHTVSIIQDRPEAQDLLNKAGEALYTDAMIEGLKAQQAETVRLLEEAVLHVKYSGPARLLHDEIRAHLRRQPYRRQ